MIRNEIKLLFEKFVIALECNQVELLNDVMTEKATIDFSTIGKHYGKTNIQDALVWRGKKYSDYQIRITNFAVHENEDKVYQSAYIQSIISYEENGFMHAFLYGGHFVNIAVKESRSWKYHIMRFDLDYVDGNTAFVENWWNLIQYEYFKGQKLRSSVVGEFDSPWRNASEVYANDEDAIKDTFYHYAFAMDTADFSDLLTTYTDDVKASMPHGVFSGKREFTEYFKYVRLKEATFSHAAVFKSIDIDGNSAHALIYRTEPNRRGTRFLHKGNKNCVFFSACYHDKFEKIDGQWYIKAVEYKSINETIPVAKSLHYLEDMEF